MKIFKKMQKWQAEKSNPGAVSIKLGSRTHSVKPTEGSFQTTGFESLTIILKSLT